jgi:tetratricopeptide (TPR) repeat protein
MAIEAQPLKTAEEYYFRAIFIHKKQGDYEKVIDDCNAAIQLDPNYQKAYTLRGIGWEAFGNWTEVEKDQSEAIRLNPKEEVSYCSRGVARFHLENIDGAIKDLSEAILIDPEYEYAYDQRANIYSLMGDFHLAIVDFSECIHINPDNPRSYQLRGWAYQNIREFDSAIKDYDKAIDLNPEYAEAYSCRADIYELEGRYSEAISDHIKFLKLGGGTEFDCTNETIEKINELKKKLDPNDNNPLTISDLSLDGQSDLEVNSTDINEQKEFNPGNLIAQLLGGENISDDPNIAVIPLGDMFGGIMKTDDSETED